MGGFVHVFQPLPAFDLSAGAPVFSAVEVDDVVDVLTARNFPALMPTFDSGSLLGLLLVAAFGSVHSLVLVPTFGSVN